MKLFLANGLDFPGTSFGADTDAAGEVVFTTGMTGYPETLTDPSYYGQIVVFTFPLIGNYATPKKELINTGIDRSYESSRIWCRGVILTEQSLQGFHAEAKKEFADWLKSQGIPALSGIDTRALTQILREKGTILGKISKRRPPKFQDKLKGNYVPQVSPQTIEILEPKHPTGKTVAFLDCGGKNGIFRNFLDRGIRVIRLPHDHNPFELQQNFDGLFISNGPGDPTTATEAIDTAAIALRRNLPVFGICLGNQILALAAGGKTKKMKYGHRGVNQPVQDLKTKRCLITSQNHGYEVDANSLPKEFEIWFRNLNDGSVEGIRHKKKPIFSIQFHPEACPGPEDAQYLFDDFIATL